jgi:hypothetical protein
MAVDTNQMIEAMGLLKKQAFEEVREGVASSRQRRLPPVEVYHMQYDQDGKPIPERIHKDVFHMDANSLINKLARQYGPSETGSGKPIWVLNLPASVVMATPHISCRHQECGQRFFTEEQREAHMRAHHRNLYQVEREKEDRLARDEQTQLLRAQIVAQQAMIDAFRGMKAEGTGRTK